jgi:putative flippase GtrA
VIAKACRPVSTARILGKATFWQLVRYLITGVSSAAMEVALFALLANVIFAGIELPDQNSDSRVYIEMLRWLMAIGIVAADKLNVFYANAISLTVAFWFTFTMNRVFSFRSKAPLLGQLGIYTTLFVFNLIATSVIVGVLVNSLNVIPVAAKTISIGCIVSWNFVLYKFLIFR